jgi:hypothetical protein
MSDIISLLKLLKDLVPPEVYANIVQWIIQYWESDDPIVRKMLRKVLIDWAKKYYPKLEPLIRKILDKILRLGLEGAKDLTLAEVGEIASVLGLSALAPLLLLLLGLVLPASKLGQLEIDLKGWFRDPCEERYKAIQEAFDQHKKDRGSFPKGFTSGSTAVGNLMMDAGRIQTLCYMFLKKCKSHKRSSNVQTILNAIDPYYNEYGNF